jgi:hypothetical protein
MQQGAREVLAAGGCASPGRAALARLDAQMLAHNASPGGAADLLPPPCFSTGLPANAFRGCYGTDYIVISCQPRPQRQSAGRRCRFRRYGSALYRRERYAQREITTSVDNSQARWKALFDRLNLINGLPAGS